MLNANRKYLPSDLDDLLADLPQLDASADLGPDVMEATKTLLDDAAGEIEKEACFRKWASRFQPCLFGRLGAKNVGGIAFDLCLITRNDLSSGSDHVRRKIQRARTAWKDRTTDGLSSGFLILFNATELCRAQPGIALMEACRVLSDLYLVEHAPVNPDVIYTETLPLRGHDHQLRAFKGGINVFYASAHGTRNHDRRVPGGLLISVNSPGHLANSLVKRGYCANLEEAVSQVRDLAWRSVGNGGMSLPAKREHSCSWHSLDLERAPGECPMKHRPKYVPENFGTRWYSALYHTDVLVPTDVTVDPTHDYDHRTVEVWPHLVLDYLSTERVTESHVNYALVHGHPITECARYQNRWPARVAVNDANGDC